METKICCKCGLEKDINEFGKDMSRKNGIKIYCKECCKKYQEENKEYFIEYRKKNNIIIKIKKKIYYKKNHKNIIKNRKSYYRKNCEIIRNKNKEYQEKNKEKLLNHKKIYYIENSKKIKNRSKIHYEKNRENILLSNKNYYNKNYNKIKEQHKNQRNEKVDNDPIYKITRNTRSRLRCFLKTKNITKRNKTFEIIGCTPSELKIYLEKQFTEGMTWKNYGFYGWHIDHKIPLDSGKSEDEILKLFHFTNLQPLWQKDNFSKGSKLSNPILNVIPMMIS